MNDKAYKIAGYIFRSLGFLAKKAVAVVLVISLMVVGYIIARDYANVYIITTDGMMMRAGVILGTEDSSQLFKFFSGTFVTSDDEFNNSRYNDYLIRDFEYNLKIKSLWCNPWNGTADVEVIESIPDIDGEKPTQNEDEKAVKPPDWQRRRFKLTFINTEGKWLINSITVIEHLEPEPAPTDEAEVTPTPQGMTPTPYPPAADT